MLEICQGLTTYIAGKLSVVLDTSAKMLGARAGRSQSQRDMLGWGCGSGSIAWLQVPGQPAAALARNRRLPICEYYIDCSLVASNDIVILGLAIGDRNW